MDKNLNKLGYLGVGIAAFGIVLSFLLILEYYGSSGALGAGLCSALGDHDSCRQVAESPYSAIRIPGLLEIPVALVGFSYYGAMAYGFFRLGSSRDLVGYRSVVNLLLPFTMLGIAVDFLLFLVSLFIIGKICSMCLMTYIVSISLFLVAFVATKKTLEVKGDSPLSGLKKNILNYAIAFLAFFAIGMVLGRSVSGDSSGETERHSLSGKNYSDFEAKPSFQIDLSGASFRGASQAPITIVKFADYNCGHCMHASHILDNLLREFDGIVKVVYMNFPLDGNCNRLVGRKNPGASSCVAATAAICADFQGKYTEMHHALFKDNEMGVMHSVASILNLASKVGLDLNEFRSCMGSEKALRQIEKEVEEAAKLNIQSTPSLFVNGKALPPGTPNPEEFRGLIRYMIQRL